MFKNRSIVLWKGFFSVHKSIMNFTSISTFREIKFSNMVVNRIVTGFLIFLSYLLTSGIIIYHSCRLTNKC
jgi:hypothetical protein